MPTYTNKEEIVLARASTPRVAVEAKLITLFSWSPLFRMIDTMFARLFRRNARTNFRRKTRFVAKRFRPLFYNRGLRFSDGSGTARRTTRSCH